MSERRLGGCELWPVPGFAAMGAIATSGGRAPVALAGPADAEGVVVVAGEALDVVRGLAAHASRQGLGVLALLGRCRAGGEAVLRGVAELAILRGAKRYGFAVQGPWAEDGLRAATGGAEVLAVLDPDPINPSVDPYRLMGTPLWIASGTEAGQAARELHARARHPRALIELPAVPRLEHAVNDVAGEIVPFLRHALAR